MKDKFKITHFRKVQPCGKCLLFISILTAFFFIPIGNISAQSNKAESTATNKQSPTNKSSHQISVGDILDIMVYNHNELTRTVKVKPDGTINYPFLENVPVERMTTEQLSNIITYQITKFTGETHMVVVGFAQEHTITVRIFGQVNHPGVYEVNPGATIQGVISSAGGTTNFASLDTIIIHREIIKNSNKVDSLLTVNMNKFLETGDIKLLPDLKNNDTIIIKRKGISNGQKVRVLGNVRVPGSLDFSIITEEYNVMDVIYLAGGPLENSDISNIRLISFSSNKPVESKINLKDYIKKGNIQQIPKVSPGDVIIVPKSRINWRSVMELLRDGILIATAYITFVNLSK